MSANAQIIHPRQFAWMISSLLVGSEILFAQREMMRIAKIDAWLSHLLPVIYALFIGAVLVSLAKRFPRKHLFEINRIVLGGLFGNLANAIIVFHLWCMLMRDLRGIAKFINTILLPNTPQEMIVLLAALPLIFYGRTSVEVVGRVNELFYPIFFVMILSIPLLLTNEIDRHLIQPLMTIDPIRFASSSLIGTGWFGDIIVIGAFLHTLWSTRQMQTAIRHGIIMSGLLLSLMMLVQVMVMGPTIPGNLVYPNYSLIQHIHITEFLDRVDIAMLSVWYPIAACKIIFIYLAFLIGITSFFKQRDYTLINDPVSLFLLLTSLLAFDSAADISNFANFAMYVLVLIYQPLLLLALILFMRKYRVVKNIEQPSEDKARGAPSDKQNGTAAKRRPPGGGLYSGKSLRSWLIAGNILLISAVLFIAVGLLYGKDYASIGFSCGIGYAACYIALTGTTHMEMMAAKKYTIKHSSGS